MILFLLACVFSPYRIEQAVQNFDRRVLIDSLQNGRFGYERERAAIGLRRISPTKPIQTAIYSLRTCLSNTKELDYVRKECAQTLGVWNDEELPELIAAAIQDVDDESRYWMAFSLRMRGDSQSRALLESLKNDSDPILAYSARQWLD